MAAHAAQPRHDGRPGAWNRGSMNYYLWTIGCQMNFADSRQAAEELEQLGYQEVDRPQDADLILLNTCVVRQSAEDKVDGPPHLAAGPQAPQAGGQAGPDGLLCRRDPGPAAAATPGSTPSSSPPTSPPSSSWPSSRQQAAQQHAVPTSEPPISNLQSPSASHQPGLRPPVHLLHRPPAARPGDQPPRERDRGRGAATWRARGVREVTLLGQNVDSYGHDLSGSTGWRQAPTWPTCWKPSTRSRAWRASAFSPPTRRT